MTFRRFRSFDDGTAEGRRHVHVKAAALAAAVVVIWTAIMLLVVPRLEVALRDTGVELPAGTKFLLGLSAWMRGFGWLLVLAIPPLVGFAVKRSGAGRGVMIALMTVALGAIVLVTVLGIFLPLLKLMESLGTAK